MTVRADLYPPRSPDPPAPPIMRQRWTAVTYLHWPVPTEAIARLLPPGLDVDTHEGQAWVGLVPFVMRDVAARVGPPLPWLSHFCETNVRTYVVGPRGPGVWFCSLDAARLLPVATALTAFRLPYRWARMAAARRGDELRFWTRRRWPGPRGARSLVGVREGERVEPDALDRFHTNRWALYTVDRAGRLLHLPVDHDAWPLRAGTLTHLRDDLVEAAGIPRPTTPPRVRVGGDVRVVAGRPRVVAGGTRSLV